MPGIHYLVVINLDFWCRNQYTKTRADICILTWYIHLSSCSCAAIAQTHRYTHVDVRVLPDALPLSKNASCLPSKAPSLAINFKFVHFCLARRFKSMIPSSLQPPRPARSFVKRGPSYNRPNFVRISCTPRAYAQAYGDSLPKPRGYLYRQA